MKVNAIDGILPEHTTVKYNTIRKLRFRLLALSRMPYFLKNKPEMLQERITSVRSHLDNTYASPLNLT